MLRVQNCSIHIEDRGQLAEVSSHHMASRDGGHIIGIDRKCLKSLSHLASPILTSLKVIVWDCGNRREGNKTYCANGIG